jgi:hypothetical protein
MASPSPALHAFRVVCAFMPAAAANSLTQHLSSHRKVSSACSPSCRRRLTIYARQKQQPGKNKSVKESTVTAASRSQWKTGGGKIVHRAAFVRLHFRVVVDDDDPAA